MIPFLCISDPSDHYLYSMTHLPRLCPSKPILPRTAFDPALLSRWSFADWIEGRTGLYWPSCLQEVAHTLNAADHWQPLLRAFDARVQPYLDKAMGAVSATAEAAADAEKTQVCSRARSEMSYQSIAVSAFCLQNEMLKVQFTHPYYL